MPGSRAFVTLVHKGGNCQRANFCAARTEHLYVMVEGPRDGRLGRAAITFGKTLVNILPIYISSG
jgi:hypothetical protein